jgi:hypothetical protein
VDLNRQLDLDRIDGLLATYYPRAKSGDTDAAKLVIRCVQHRATLTGIESLPSPGRSHPQNTLIWIRQALPNINRLVETTVGLRRKEIDLLEWTAFHWEQGVLRIEPTKYFRPKNEDRGPGRSVRSDL